VRAAFVRALPAGADGDDDDDDDRGPARRR
jgi:hypothetical protein